MKLLQPYYIVNSLITHVGALLKDDSDVLRDKYQHPMEFFLGLLDKADISVKGSGTLIEGPAIIVQNHVSTLDIPAIYCAWKDIRPNSMDWPIIKFVAKKELFGYPILGRGLRALDMICIDRKDTRTGIRSLYEGITNLKKDEYALIYPEGTRANDYSLEGRIRTSEKIKAFTHNAMILPDVLIHYLLRRTNSEFARPRKSGFKSGAFHASYKANIPIQPVVAVGSQELMPRGQWYANPGEIKLQVLDSLNPWDYRNPKEQKKAAKQSMLTAIQEMRPV